MAGSFRIAEGYVEVTADETAYDRAMQRLQQKKNKVGITLELDDSGALAKLRQFADQHARTVLKAVLDAELSQTSIRRVSEQLERLTKDRTVEIFASLDTRAAAADLALLTRPRTARITADADTRSAADDLALLTRPRTARITADADTNGAATRLGVLTRDRRVNVRVDVDRGGLGILSSIGGSSSSASGGLAGLISKVVKLSAIAGSALPTLVSLGQSILSMGPAAALAAPAVLSLGAAFAAIKIGTSGIGAAFKAAFAPAVSSGNAAAASTRRVEDAQRSLAKAQQGVKDAEQRAAEARVQAARQIEDAQRSLKSTVQDVADANRRAAQEVAQSERDLADAQRAARQAQLDLNAARKQAAEDLQDLNNRLSDAQLDQRQAVLDLQDAQQNLDAVKAKGGKAGEEEFDKAQLQYDKAQQNLQEQQTETERLQQQTADANKAGVEGSKTVVDAKQKVSDANRDVTDKTQDLQNAELEQTRTAQEGAQKVADAERAVADARAAAAKAAVDGARDVADAQQAVADAARNLADAQTAGAAAVSKTADALAKLAPNAREFVNAVVAQAGAWRALKLDVQNALFAGLGEKFTAMSAAILPSLTAGLVGTAGVLNTMAKNAADAVTNLGKTGQLRQMFDGLNAGLKPLARVPAQIITGLTQLSIAASPAFARLTTAAAGAADKISQKLGDAFKSGRLEGAISGAIDIAKQFGKVIGDIAGTIGNIFKAAGAAGGDALGTIGAVFSELRRITAMPEVQAALTSVFKALQSIAQLIAGGLGAAIQAALPLMAQLAPFVQELAEKFGPVLTELLGTLGEALAPIIAGLMPIVMDIADALVGLVQAVMPLLQPVGDLIGAILDALGPLFKMTADNLTIVLGAVGTALAPIVEALVPAVKMFGDLFAQLAPLFPPLYEALVPLLKPLGDLVVSLIQLAVQVITPLMPLIVGLAQILTGVLAGALGVLVPVLTTVIGWITTFVDAVTDAVKWVADKFQALFDFLVGHSLIPDLVNGIIGWFKTLWSKTKELFTALKNGVIQIWKDLWGAVKDKWSSFWGGFKSVFTGAWRTFKDSVSALKTGITNTWNSLWNGVRDKVTSIFSTIGSKISAFKSGVKTAFSSLRDGLGTIWNGIKSKIGSPIKWVISNVYNSGIRKMWNAIAGKISSKITLPAISLGFSQGGVVPGKRSNRDSVPAMLAPGERVLSNAQVDQLGGHRGIDAMLGKDHPTKTGGNPTSQQERRRHQPMQGFASGGIIGTVTDAIGGAVGSVASWAKDVVVGGLKSAAQKALSALVRPLINRIPNTGIGNLMKGLANKAVDGMMGWFTNEDKKAVGGPAVQKALAWVKTQNGLPYQWAGNGNPSWDCSGLMSAIESVIRGEKPHRRWATGSFSGSSGPSGWVRNLNSPFMIGITNAGVGHTAGTLAGLNVESSGGRGVHMGKSARGYNDSLFTSRWGFKPATKYDTGGLLADGATMVLNGTGRPERILTPEQNALFERLVTGQGGGSVVIENITVSGTFDFSKPSAAKQAARQLVVAVKEELRQYDRGRAR